MTYNDGFGWGGGYRGQCPGRENSQALDDCRRREWYLTRSLTDVLQINPFELQRCCIVVLVMEFVYHQPTLNHISHAEEARCQYRSNWQIAAGMDSNIKNRYLRPDACGTGAHKACDKALSIQGQRFHLLGVNVDVGGRTIEAVVLVNRSWKSSPVGGTTAYRHVLIGKPSPSQSRS